MKGKPTSPEIKALILKSFIEDGVSVSQLAVDYNLNINTIYKWLKEDNQALTGIDTDKQKLLLENTRLKRDKQELIDLIGRLTIDVDKLNKKKISCFEISKLPKPDRLNLARVCIRDNPDTNKTLLSKLLNLNRTTLYVRQIKEVSDKIIGGEIKNLLKDNPFYGYRRVAIYFGFSDNKARRIMRKYNIFPIYKKLRYIVKKDDLLKPSSIFTNQLKIFIQDNKLTKPNQAWSTDFTYLPYRYSFLYLSTVIDTYTKEILGFHISKRHTTEMTLAALKMATSGRGHPMIHHSDQGSEYKAESYQQYLQDNNIICSMSKKSSPWENGYQESFYGKYRYELGNLNRFKTEIEAIEAIILQLHYYNNKRIHTTIRDTPVLFRQKELKRLRLEEETKVSSFSRA